MRFRLGLAIGFGVGYVLGTKAGHEQYERIMGATQRFWESQSGQQIKEATSKVADAAGELARGVKDGMAGAAPPAPTPPSTPEPEVPAPAGDIDGTGNGKV